jgi:uncharacterized protein YbjT (DUF2867 family)
MKVVITGSLGNISLPLAQELISQKHTVVIVSRDAAKQAEIEALGATAAIGSVEDAAFLTTAFSGADAVYAMVPPNFGAPDPVAYYENVGNSYVTAIRNAGVKRAVLLSSWGAHASSGTGIIVGSHRTEVIFDELTDVARVYLRAGSFYNNLFHQIGMIKNAGFMATNYGGEDKIVLVSTKDIAEAAAKALLGTNTGVVYVASTESTCNEIAAVLGAAIGKPDLQWHTFTDEQVKESMLQRGMPAAMVGMLVELNAAIHSGLMREDYDKHKPALGKVKLEEFAKEFAAVYNEGH